MNPADPQREPLPVDLAETALRWAERRRAGLADAERREFQAWLAADPRHARAFRAAEGERDELDWPLYSGKTDAVIVGLERRARRRRVRRFAFAGIAAAAAVMALLVTPQSREVKVSSPGSTLLVIEPKRQTLPDGTVAELMPGAEIVVEFEERYRFVTLRRGTVHFDVAANPERPFVVRVGEIAVRAVGTAFAIELKPDAVKVLVTHGRVALDDDSAPAVASRAASVIAEPLALVSAGSLAVVERTSAAEPTARAPVVRPTSDGDLEDALAWRTPRLEFSGTPLAEVVATMNRYNHVRFVVVDDSLALVKLSGALRSDKVDALVQILEADFPIRAERRGGRVIELHRR